MKQFIKNISQSNPYKFSIKDFFFLSVLILYGVLSVLFNFKHLGNINIINNLQNLMVIIIPLYGAQEGYQVYTDYKAKQNSTEDQSTI